MTITKYLTLFIQKVSLEFRQTSFFVWEETASLAFLPPSLSLSLILARLYCIPFTKTNQIGSIASTGKFTKLKHTYKCILLIHNVAKL